MKVRQHKTNEASNANHLTADFDKGGNAECRNAGDTKQYGAIRRRYFEDVTFGLSVFMMLFLMASVIASAFYTVR